MTPTPTPLFDLTVNSTNIDSIRSQSFTSNNLIPGESYNLQTIITNEGGVKVYDDISATLWPISDLSSIRGMSEFNILTNLKYLKNTSNIELFLPESVYSQSVGYIRFRIYIDNDITRTRKFSITTTKTVISSYITTIYLDVIDENDVFYISVIINELFVCSHKPLTDFTERTST